MKILVLADIHGRSEGLDTALQKIAEHTPDVVAVCGDITDYGMPKGWAKTFLMSIKQRARNDCKLLAIPGNCDYLDVINEITRFGINVHSTSVVINDVTFIGLGGSNPTPFRTAFWLPEKEIYNILDAQFSRIKDSRIVLMVHVPPKGYLDEKSHGVHVGSDSMRDIVDRYIPNLVLSAHVHESRGIHRTDKTVFVNPGPAFYGFAAVVTIHNDEIYAELV